MIESITFPVLTFSKPNVIEFAKDVDELTRCNRLGLKNGYYKNLKIIDSNGNSFIVTDATKIGTIGPFWGINIFLEQRIRVSLEFMDRIEKITLDNFKRKIIDLFDKDKYFWNSGGNLDDLKKMIMSAENHEEIIQRLGVYMQGK